MVLKENKNLCRLLKKTVWEYWVLLEKSGRWLWIVDIASVSIPLHNWISSNTQIVPNSPQNINYASYQ